MRGKSAMSIADEMFYFSETRACRISGHAETRARVSGAYRRGNCGKLFRDPFSHAVVACP